MSKKVLFPHVPKKKEPLFPHVPRGSVTWKCPQCGRINDEYPYPTRCSRCGWLRMPALAPEKTNIAIIVTRPSDSPFRKGQIVSKKYFDETSAWVRKQGGELPIGEPIEKALIQPDWGYYIEVVGNLKGEFRRAKTAVPVKILETSYGGYSDDVLVEFQDGKKGIADIRSLSGEGIESKLAMVELHAKTETDPKGRVTKFCCRFGDWCAPPELLEEGRFLDRIAALRQHYKEKHPGLWGKRLPE